MSSKQKKKQQIIETYIFENECYRFKIVSSHEIKEAETTARYKDANGEVMGSVDMPGAMSGDDTVENEHLTLEITYFKGEDEKPFYDFQLRPEDFDGLYNMLTKTIKQQRGMY